MLGVAQDRGRPAVQAGLCRCDALRRLRIHRVKELLVALERVQGAYPGAQQQLLRHVHVIVSSGVGAQLALEARVDVHSGAGQLDAVVGLVEGDGAGGHEVRGDEGRGPRLSAEAVHQHAAVLHCRLDEDVGRGDAGKDIGLAPT